MCQQRPIVILSVRPAGKHCGLASCGHIQKEQYTAMKVDINELIETIEPRASVERQEAIGLIKEEREVIAIALRVLKQVIGRGPFITGTVEETDTMGLHDGYMICPAVGLEGFALYRKSSKYTAPGW
jgi:hypothetical protein